MDDHFVCDECGSAFLPETDTYIGPKDKTDTRCDPFVAFVYFCKDCAVEKGYVNAYLRL